MNSLSVVARSTKENAIGSLAGVHIRREKTIHVLSLGPVDRGSMVYDALLNGPNFHLTIATDYRELWGMSAQESIQVAILHNTLTTFETEAACRLIRRRWLHARILVASAEESNLEDALYDERVAPFVAPEVLLTTIDRQTGGWHEGRSGEVEI
jgi:hypothetical protein